MENKIEELMKQLPEGLNIKVIINKNKTFFEASKFDFEKLSMLYFYGMDILETLNKAKIYFDNNK